MSKRIGELIRDLFQVSEATIIEALEIQNKVGGYLGQILIKLGVITEKQLLEALSIQLNLPILEKEIVDEEITDKLPDLNFDYLLENNFLPLYIDNNYITLVTNDPLRTYILDYISKKTNKKCKVFLTEERRIRDLSRKILKTNKEKLSFIETTPEHLKDMAYEVPVIKYLNDLITQAMELNASDIHFQPSEKFLVRLRIDGVLQDYDYLREDFFLAVVSRVKLLAGLDIAEKRLPQDGKFSMKIGSTYLDLRVSTLPTTRGEDVVIRLLHRGKLDFSLNSLGLEEDHLKILTEMLKHPHGMILVTGPTGSGKTTTLYSIISMLKSPGVKIITVEDPVEYQMDGLTQIQVKPEIGLTYAQMLKHILRHDPDIIMIGEIRDKETAQIAFQSALTGHLVLSTLHTNDSLSTLFRLIDMGVEKYLINACLIGVIAQRILRINCSRCSDSIAYDEFLRIKEIENVLNRFQNLIAKPTLKKGKGCKDCLYTGYRGRTAIFEILYFDEIFREIFAKSFSISELRKYTNTFPYFRSLREDGFIKVLKGVTTIEEVLRVS